MRLAGIKPGDIVYAEGTHWLVTSVAGPEGRARGVDPLRAVLLSRPALAPRPLKATRVEAAWKRIGNGRGSVERDG